MESADMKCESATHIGFPQFSFYSFCQSKKEEMMSEEISNK